MSEKGRWKSNCVGQEDVEGIIKARVYKGT